MTSPTRRKLLLTAAFGCLLMAAAGCEVNSPEMPTFDTTFVVPLGTERIEVMDAVNDEDYLAATDDGGLLFNLTGDPDTLGLDFDLSADIPAQTISQGLGNFALPDPAPLGYGFQLSDIWAPAAGVSNLTTTVPAFPIDVTSSGQGLADLTTATLSEGLLTITVTNNLPVAIGADSGPDQLVLDLLDEATGGLVTRIVFPVLAAGQATTRVSDLAGVTLPAAIAVQLQGGSGGSNGQPVTVSGTDTLNLDVTFSNLVVSAATAVVAAQSFATSFDTALPADYAISRAVIASGGSDLALVNNMPLPCTAVVTWDQIRNVDGNPLQQIITLPAGSSATATIDFGGYIVQAPDVPLTTLSAAVAITTPGSGGQQVPLTAGDGLTATLTGGTIAFSSVTGTVPAFNVPLDPITETIDLPDEMSGLELTAASLSLVVTNSAGVPADIDLSLIGIAASGATRSLQTTEQILPAVGRAAATTTIVLDQTNSTIVDFLNNLPETITLTGDVSAGGNGATGTVHAQDFAVVGWQIAAPVEVVITGATLDGDPSALDLDADLADRITTHAGSAVLRTEILNHLPMAVQLRIVAAQDTTQFDTNPLLSIGPVAVDAAQVDPATHVVSNAVTSRPVISLTAEEARLLGRPGLYTRVQAVLPDTNGQPVRVMSTDYLEFQGVVELEVRIDDEL